MSKIASFGARFRAAVAEEQPLQVVGTITAKGSSVRRRISCVAPGVRFQKESVRSTTAKKGTPAAAE